MNTFEHFTLIYFVIDAYYQDNQNEELRLFLSDMCPFTFTEIGSAVSYVYDDYCGFIANQTITMGNSYALAKAYIDFLVKSGISCVANVFEGIDENAWLDGAKEYLSSEHKGRNM